MPRRISVTLALALLLAVAALAAQQLSVQVRETRMRVRPSYLGPATETVSYGDRLTVLEERGPWRHVRTDGGATGWLHASALTEKRVVLQAGDTDVATGADEAELALAGKGFNAEVEEAFKQQNADIDYTWVDRMSAWTVTPEQAAAFLADGQVGGAK